MLHPWVGGYTPCYTRGYEGCGHMHPVGMRDVAICTPWVWEVYPVTPVGMGGLSRYTRGS